VSQLLELRSGRKIGAGQPTYVIAEAGSNWRMGAPKRDLAMAHALIDVAKDAGCDAVKFQTYKSHTVYAANAGESDYLAESGIKESINDIFDDLSMPYEMIEKLAAYAKRRGIDFMSTPFSKEDADAVDPFVDLHKIASYEISHTQLQAHLAKKGKPIVFSTGASTYERYRLRPRPSQEERREADRYFPVHGQVPRRAHATFTSPRSRRWRRATAFRSGCPTTRERPRSPPRPRWPSARA